jgi:putative component of membrane protein insertase Oxa1/YidC/SpoIIIJ protein YidD
MAEAIKKYGLYKGSMIGLRRLVRCQPFGTAGYDPVP